MSMLWNVLEPPLRSVTDAGKLVEGLGETAAERLAAGEGTSAVDRSTSEYLVSSIGDLAAWVLGGLLLLWLMRLVVALVEVSPLPAPIKASLLRFAPVVEVTVAVAYVTSALVELLAEEPDFAWTLIALIVVLAVLSWSALYDLASGIVFRVAQVCQVGDLVDMGDVQGRVLEVGTRALVLQTRQGDEAVVPYGSIARSAIRRTQSVSGAYVHSFELSDAPGEDVAAIKRTVGQAVLCCHWASVVHEPKVERREGGAIEVSVYAHDADHAPLVEAVVRQALSRAGGSKAEAPKVEAKAEASVFDGAPKPKPLFSRLPPGKS